MSTQFLPSFNGFNLVFEVLTNVTRVPIGFLLGFAFFSGFCLVFASFTGLCLVFFQSFNECDWVPTGFLPSFFFWVISVFFRCFPGCNWVPTGFYLVLPVFTGFYLVLPCFLGC